VTDSFKHKTVCVRDHGLFVALAERLVRDFQRVLYAPAWKRGLPTYHEVDVGSGLDGIEVVKDFWTEVDKDQIDLYLYPDILDGDEQLHLRKLGKRVWGSGHGEELELYRHYGKQILEAVGLPVQPYRAIRGLDALREYLKTHRDKHVKLSLLRGITETFRHGEYWETEPRLDELQYRLGMRKYEQEFLVEDDIPTAIEVGADTYCVDGKWPGLIANGIEKKDCAYGCVVQAYDELPDEIKVVLEYLAPVLAKYNYRNFFSTEIRVAKDGTPYMIDPTCRMPSPGGECEMELYLNLAEILWHGAEGKLIEPEIAAPCAVQAIITCDRADENWSGVTFPEEIRQWVKLYYHCRKHGHDYTLPQISRMEEVGSVIALGDTKEAAAKLCRERAEQISGDHVHVKVEEIERVFDGFDEMKKRGMNVEAVAA